MAGRSGSPPPGPAGSLNPTCRALAWSSPRWELLSPLFHTVVDVMRSKGVDVFLGETFKRSGMSGLSPDYFALRAHIFAAWRRWQQVGFCGVLFRHSSRCILYCQSGDNRRQLFEFGQWRGHSPCVPRYSTFAECSQPVPTASQSDPLGFDTTVFPLRSATAGRLVNTSISLHWR